MSNESVLNVSKLTGISETDSVYSIIMQNIPEFEDKLPGPSEDLSKDDLLLDDVTDFSKESLAPNPLSINVDDWGYEILDTSLATNTQRKETITRKCKRDHAAWKRNVSKRMWQSGKPYITTSGKFRESRSPANIGAHNKCCFKCLQNIPEQKRIDICNNSFLKCDWSCQNDFINKCTDIVSVGRRSNASKERKESDVFYSDRYSNQGF